MVVEIPRVGAFDLLARGLAIDLPKQIIRGHKPAMLVGERWELAGFDTGPTPIPLSLTTHLNRGGRNWRKVGADRF